MVPAATAAARSFFSAATSASMRPAADFPLVSSANWASVLPDRSDVSKSAGLRPRYVAAASSSSPRGPCRPPGPPAGPNPPRELIVEPAVLLDDPCAGDGDPCLPAA